MEDKQHASNVKCKTAGVLLLYESVIPNYQGPFSISRLTMLPDRAIGNCQ
jgi:hypothetical protein